MILYHAADLIWASKIKGAADAIGVQARPVRSIEMLEARLADSPVRALLVDLEAPDLAVALIQRARQHRIGTSGAAIRTLAYGPHVATERFEAARAAGADAAIARGAFDQRMSMILRDLDADDRKQPS